MTDPYLKPNVRKQEKDNVPDETVGDKLSYPPPNPHASLKFLMVASIY